MKFRQLLETLREKTVILLLDELAFICSAPKDSPVLAPYMERNVAFINLPSKVLEGDTFGADLIVTLDIEKQEE